MYLQVKEIVLWPRNHTFEPRRVPFALGKVTVISGASRTGKSAVIPIIDYCLASRGCSIPVKAIRDACEWFGIVISTSSGEKLLARREPGAQRSTDDMYLLEAPEITDIPSIIAKNTNAGDIRRLLDELAGLSNLDFGDGLADGGFEARPSFRDLSAFLFQPQNVVANPEILFFKTDQYEHREKLRRIFPYILGAITPALLAKQHEMSRIKSELRRKERELKDATDVSAQWMADLRAKVSEARELGLLNSDHAEGDLSRSQMLAMLRELVDRTDATISVSASTISEAIQELNQLNVEEAKVSFNLTKLRRRLAEMNRMRESASDYHEALRIQRDRLKLSDWLLQHRDDDICCPICGGGMEPSKHKLNELKQSLVVIEGEAGDIFEIPAAFDREMVRVQNDVSEATEQLKAIQMRQSALSHRSQEASTQQYQARKAERFIGNLENALHLHSQIGGDSGLQTEVVDLRERSHKLDAELRTHNLEERKRRALRIVNANAARLMPLLDSERPEDPVSLEINDLTVKVTGANREDYLSEIGSGSNWLSYHIAVTLALHQFFLTLEHSPVPGFLIMDQPSQVYFPKKLVVRESETPDEPKLDDEDIEAVRKAFQVMGKVAEEAKSRLQIIVLDHAPREVWGEIPNVVAFEEWREGTKLVPENWIP